LEFYRGRLVDHVNIFVRDFKASRKFYKAILQALEIPITREGKDWLIADELVVAKGSPRSGGLHLALQARDKAMVERFHKVAIKSGGCDQGAPGFRDHHPYYYAVDVLDPDGNHVEAVNHGPVTRSADAVVIKPSALALLKSWF
jgi:catechol 2,3-dioxygenase-like lactoylglutathione lyase family enzyme